MGHQSRATEVSRVKWPLLDKRNVTVLGTKKIRKWKVFQLDFNVFKHILLVYFVITGIPYLLYLHL